MKITKLEIRNFLSIGEMTIDFDNYKSLTLIEGINDDSSTASSNGAGKSSIFEAIYWCLYGKTKRGLTGDSVINESAKKDCVVKVYFDGYTVSRGRGPNFLTIEKDGNDLTKGTARDTQDVLDGIIGMSELTFSKVAQFGQGDIKDFAALTDAELKQIFEQSLGLGFFAEKLQKTKEKKAELSGKHNDLTQDMSSTDREIEFLKDKIQTLKKAREDMRLEREKMILSLSSEMEAEMRHQKDKTEELATKEIAIAKAAKELEKSSERRKEVSEEKSRVQRELDMTRSERASIEREIKSLSQSLKSEMDSLNNMPQECSQCKRPYDKESLMASANVIAERIRNLKQKLDEEKRAVEVSKEKESRSEAKFGAVEATFKELSSVQSSIAALNVERSYLITLKKDIDASMNRINYLDSQIQSLKKQNGGSDEEEVKAKEKLKGLETERIKLGHTAYAVEHEIEVVKALEEILGNGGLKSYIFDNITPELNRVISEYMNILNPSISIEISTISKLKSGEYRDKFSIAVATDNGAAEYKGNSAGERQLINLAISLGFNALCRTISQSSANILFLDEPFESLDETASEKAVELCKLFASSIDCPFIISHNQSIKDLVSSRMIVRKNGGKTALVKAVNPR